MEVIALGVAAGITTTLAGMGGGLLMLLAFALIHDPLTALVVTSPALLLGNGHRAWMYRSHVDGDTVRRVLVGAVPGSVLGGLLATAAPAALVSGMMVLMAGLALARSTGRLSWRPPQGAVAPIAGVAGFVNATAGGAGVLLGPLLLARGLVGTTYVATMATAAVVMHITRLGIYSAAGAVGPDELWLGGQLAAALVLGNLLGHRLRQHLTPRTESRIQVGVMVTTVSLALLGLKAVVLGAA